MAKVLYLTPWYPSEKDAMAGLFVQKHVEAVRAQGIEVQVIDSTSWLGIWRQWRALQREGWTPDVVQLNVIQKQGLLALWLKKHHHIPYLIIEHWSGYLPENGQFAKFHTLKQMFFRYICQNAEEVLTVSPVLQKSMQACGLEAKQWGTIDNVVDEFFFKDSHSERKQPEVKTLLHVSCFDERAKNITGLLNAVKLLANNHKDWQIVCVGEGVDYNDVYTYADALGLLDSGIVRFTGELTPQEVAEWMHKADALVLSSRYETYGVVLAEATAAGLPILSTPVGIAEEIADLIVPQEIAQHHPHRFAEFIETILWTPQKRANTPDFRTRFSAEAIGKQLKKIYEQCMVSE